jgi:glucarate dehydratase
LINRKKENPMITGTPTVTDMQVIPVAGYDSMLMTLSGAHAPYFTRNIVILKDSAGHTGIGEIHGGEYTCEALKSCIPLVVGEAVGKYRSVLDKINKASPRSKDDDGEGIQSLDISKLKFVVKAEWAIECALLDLLGQYMELPMCELLGNGKQRDEVETLGYLFYVSDKKKAESLQYIDESDSNDPWYRLRREPMLTPERIVEQALVLNEKYGFRNFKLKGGVLPGEDEMVAIAALKKQFPDGRINIDPNGAWSLTEAIALCKPMEGVLTYVEDPCGPEAGYSGREIMAEFKNRVNLPVATNMIATDWRQFYHAASMKSVDIVLADPHFWGFDGSVRMAQVLNDWGLTWGSHSNNHFDITLTAFVHAAAAAPGTPTALDTHWIWQDGQNLLSDAPRIVNGYIQVPNKPGLGVTIDMDRVMEANKLYNSIPYHDRDDAMAMQYLIPGWKFDSKKPALCR